MSTQFTHSAYRATVAVPGSALSLVVLDVRKTSLVTVSFKNPDASQSVSVTFNSRCHALDDLAPRAVFEDMTDIPPLQTRSVDVPVGNAIDLEVLAVASGAGVADAVLTVVPGDWRRP
jgi:hypothetical protein